MDNEKLVLVVMLLCVTTLYVTEGMGTWLSVAMRLAVLFLAIAVAIKVW